MLKSIICGLLCCISLAIECQAVCNSGFFGPTCDSVCHCLSGNSVCDTNTGVCLDYLCDRGWTGAPTCQTPCPFGFFGGDCQYSCHCYNQSTCNVISGVCEYPYCDPQYWGPSCQLRLPKLISPPIVNATCTTLLVKWAAWTQNTDIGDPPVVSYLVETNINNGTWLTVTTVPETGLLSYTLTVSNVSAALVYQFRVTANTATSSNKLVAGFPGPSSAFISLLYCPGPSTVPGTTQPPPTTLPRTTAPPPTTLPPTSGPVTNININFIGSVPTMTWQAPVGGQLTGYNLTYTRLGVRNCSSFVVPPPATTVISLNANMTSFPFVNLFLWSDYVIYIQPLNLAGPGTISSINIQTPEQSPSGTVTNLQVSAITARYITITWSDVPCQLKGGDLVRYDILVLDVTNGLNVITDTSLTLTYTAFNLRPYNTYGFNVRFVNKIGPSSYSNQVTALTLQDVPSAPGGPTLMETTSVSVAISWTAPSSPNGVLTNYRIIYWSATTPGVVLQAQQPSSLPLIYNITGLTPFTVYSIQLQAQSQALINGGWGNTTAALTALTQDGVPGPPLNLARRFRNTTCLQLQWSPPSSSTANGVITQYVVSYAVVVVASVSTNGQTSGTVTLPAVSQPSAGFCGLVTAAQYSVSVSARTRTSLGPPVTDLFWTQIGVPTIPPTPRLTSATNTTLTIVIQPAVLLYGPVSGYFIVVAQVPSDSIPPTSGKRKRRSTISDPTTFIPLPGYTCASLAVNSLLSSSTFVVGDGQTYDGYVNSALNPNTLYNIFFVVASSLDGVTLMAFSQISSPASTVSNTVTTPPPTAPPSSSTTTSSTTTSSQPSIYNTVGVTEQPQTTEAPADNTRTIVLAVVLPIVFLLLIALALLLLYFCWWKKRKERENNKPWLDYYTKNFGDQLVMTDPAKWSNTYDLTEPRHPIILNGTIRDFDIRVSDMPQGKSSIQFEDEYRRLPAGKTQPWSVGERVQNSTKNRFPDILAYDHSRVVLVDVEGDGSGSSDSDYINANYIAGFMSPKEYIAAQSPFDRATICDFWQMVHQQRSPIIVMLCQLKEEGVVKCEQYWPNSSITAYGSIVVRHVRTDEFANFTTHAFDVGRDDDGAVRRVTQFQFTDWQRHQCPDDPIPFLEFVLKVKALAAEYAYGAPVIVHCGTGISRSAVFIAVSSLLDQARDEHKVNVYDYCKRMRESRINMVRTLAQYRFIYDVLYEGLLTNLHIIGENLKVNYRLLSNINPVTDKSYFREQFEVLEANVPALTEGQCKEAMMPENLKKCRFPSIVAPDAHRVIIKSTHGLGTTDFINALFLDSYARKDAFIVTQTPLVSTVGDFWKMIYDHEVNTIVAMNGPDFHEDTLAVYWPGDNSSTSYGTFLVDSIKVTETRSMIIRELQLTGAHQPSRGVRPVTLFQFKAWPMYEKVPSSREAVLALLSHVDRWRETTASQQRPLVVHCMDGASQSGLFCACYVLCQKMTVDGGDVDVFHTIKHMKQRRRHFINSLEQYKFCFKLLWDYMNANIHNKVPLETQVGGYANETQSVASLEF